jgi:hypothetical protein
MKHQSVNLIFLVAALLACKHPSKPGTTSAQAAPGAAPTGAASTTGGAPAPATGAGATPMPAGHGPLVSLPFVVGHARTANGYVKIPGEIHNNTKEWMRFVEAHVTLLDSSGKPINVKSVAAAMGKGEGVYSARSVLPPGEIAVFEYTRDMEKLARPYASYKVSADAVPTDGSMSAKVEGVSTSHNDLGFYSVAGTVVSTGPAGCRSPHAVIGMYAADGKLWEVEATTIDTWFQKVMPKGKSVAFKRKSLPDGDGKVKTVKVWGDCEL